MARKRKGRGNRGFHSVKNPSGLFIIYALVDPRDHKTRYIGITSNTLPCRLAGHLRSSREGEKTKKADWIRQLQALGLAPQIVPLEETIDPLRECFWIYHYQKIGIDLTNGTVGGDGTGLKDAQVRKFVRALKK